MKQRVGGGGGWLKKKAIFCCYGSSLIHMTCYNLMRPQMTTNTGMTVVVRSQAISAVH